MGNIRGGKILSLALLSHACAMVLIAKASRFIKVDFKILKIFNVGYKVMFLTHTHRQTQCHATSQVQCLNADFLSCLFMKRRNRKLLFTKYCPEILQEANNILRHNYRIILKIHVCKFMCVNLKSIKRSFHNFLLRKLFISA
jgi:hypothetical protein